MRFYDTFTLTTRQKSICDCFNNKYDRGYQHQGTRYGGIVIISSPRNEHITCLLIHSMLI